MRRSLCFSSLRAIIAKLAGMPKRNDAMKERRRLAWHAAAAADRVYVAADDFTNDQARRTAADEGQTACRGECGKHEFFEEERAMLYDQLDKLTSRSRLLQRALTTFYLAVGVFVATSVAIGGVAFFYARGFARGAWIPVVMGLIGAVFLFYGSMLAVFEARLALSTLLPPLTLTTSVP
jgi:hypothetical protein